MKAYVIAAETVNDQAMFDIYRQEAVVTLPLFGKQFMVRGGTLTARRGMAPPASCEHRVSDRGRRRALVQLSRKLRGDLPKTKQLCWERDHCGRADPVMLRASRGRV